MELKLYCTLIPIDTHFDLFFIYLDNCKILTFFNLRYLLEELGTLLIGKAVGKKPLGSYAYMNFLLQSPKKSAVLIYFIGFDKDKIV